MTAFFIDGAAFWAPTLPGWDAARAAFRGESGPQEPPAKRPSPQLLPAAERRRAPDTVALALEVAGAAVAASGHDPKSLPSVFVSAHGDLAINDHLCSMLASTPTLISPTKFHNSVHNAAAGYWTMGVGCHEASTALTAFEFTFANGLLAAAIQCASDGRPVLLVGYDVQVVGALQSVTRSESMLAVALVLSPELSGQSCAPQDGQDLGPAVGSAGGSPVASPVGQDTGRRLARVEWRLAEAEPGAGFPPLRSAAARALAGNALCDALPFFETLALGDHAPLRMPLSPRQSLCLALAGTHPAG